MYLCTHTTHYFLKTHLFNIANVHSGIYAKPDYQGEVYYVQARHFDSDLEFNTQVKPDLKLEGKIAKHLLQIGDVLLAAKGNDNFAVQYKGIIKPAVASSMFIVIRIKDSNVLPEYVTWFLNLEATQTYLRASSRGSDLRSLTQSIVEQIEIVIPPLQKQRAVVEFQTLRKKERILYKKLDELKEQEIQTLLLTSLK